jgi:hypothetical protein
MGATAILAELQALQIRPQPSLRTIERVLERNGVTLPKVRLAPYLATTTYPTPAAAVVCQVLCKRAGRITWPAERCDGT